MSGQCSMSIKPSVSIPTHNNLLHRSSNFKKARVLYFPVSRLTRNGNSRQNTTSISFQRQCTNKENLGESKAFGGDLELWKQFFPGLQMKKEALSAILKWVALRFVSLLHLKSYKIETKNMRVSFNDLFGVDDIILEFQDIISILHGKSECKKPMTNLPNGVLLYGPLGTGKSTLVYAMAREARVSFFRVSACDIAGGDVKIKSLFNEARRCSPSIVYVNQIDLIASIEGNRESYPALIQLHTEMDKCNKDGEMVVVIADTGKPETLDPAFMNSSRFYKTYHVAIPDQDSRHKKAALCFKDHIKDEDKEAICNLVASETVGIGWDPLEDIVIVSKMAAEDRGGDYVTIDDVRKTIRRYDEYIRLMKILYQGYEDVKVIQNKPMQLIAGSIN